MGSRSRGAAWRLAGALALLACAPAPASAAWSKEKAPIPAPTLALIAAKGTTAAAPILMRAYKKEAELEVWKKGRDGRYVLLKTFPICRWSGGLGPKQQIGDRQTPEGFYSVGPRQMNPNSSYHLSFDTGFPNPLDRARGATGAYLMVHGNCSSAGCFAMTDKGIEEIYALAREAFAGGQAAFQFQAFPFRMTAQNMARYRTDPSIAFWRQLKEGSDRFEATGEEPAVGVAGTRYVFGPSRDAAREALAQRRRADEEAKVAALVADGVAAARTTYADGGQHPSFRALVQTASASLGTVSRPEALALAGRDVIVIPARTKAPVQVAKAAPAAAPAPVAQVAARVVTAAVDPALLAAPQPAAAWPMARWAMLSGSAHIIVPPEMTKRSFEVASRL